jgi:hypothetical protein
MVAHDTRATVAARVPTLARDLQHARDILDQLEHCDAQAAYLLAHSLTKRVETLLDDSKALRAELFELAASQGTITLHD